MTDFPANIRTLDAATFAQTSEDPAIQGGKMEGGYVLSRPRFTRRPRRTFAFEYVDMTDADMAALQGFWDQVRGSSNAFNWTHPATGQVINVRFDSAMGKIKFSREGYGPINRWKSDTIILTEV